MIPKHLYQEIISVLPIICVDVVIRNRSGKVLLARRKNEPIKDHWWVIGGRILSGESAHQACIRKTFEETGLKINQLKFLGFYEDVYDKNAFNVPKPYHTFSLAFETQLSGDRVEEIIRLDSQHSDWGWFDELPERFIISPQNKLFSKLDKK